MPENGPDKPQSNTPKQPRIDDDPFERLQQGDFSITPEPGAAGDTPAQSQDADPDHADRQPRRRNEDTPRARKRSPGEEEKERQPKPFTKLGRMLRATPHSDGVKHEILEKSQWVELVDEQRYKVEQGGKKGTAAWEVDFADFKDFQPDEPTVEEPAGARDSLESDVQEILGSEGMVIRNKIRDAFARYGDRVGMAAIQGGLRREGVTNFEELQNVRNLMTDILRGVRPSDVSKRVTIKLMKKDKDIFKLLRDLPETLDTWRQEEDNAFIDEVFIMGNRGGSVRRFFGGGASEKEIKHVLKFILSSNVTSLEQVSSVLAARVGKRFAQSVSANVFQYATGESEGDRKAEMLERTQFFGMTDPEVEAFVKARRR